MSKALLAIFSVAMITLAGVTTGLFMRNGSNTTDLTTETPVNKMIIYNEDVKVDQLSNSLNLEKDVQKQQQLIKNFMLENHKFFSANQILKVLMPIEQGLNRNYAINIMKPYISPLTTDEAVQILQLFFTQDGLASGIIVSQVYDLHNSDENIIKLLNVFGYPYFRDAILIPQSKRYFSTNLAITAEGKHVGVIVDNSNSMCQIVGKRDDGSNITRWTHIQNFYGQTRGDIYQNYNAFSFNFIGKNNTNTGESLFTWDQGGNRMFNAAIYMTQNCTGESDLLVKLEKMISNNNNLISDIYIWTDASTLTENDSTEIINKINYFNSQRRTEVRVNTISFMIGGEESQEVRDRSVKSLQAISDATGGTFMTFIPQ